MGGSRRPARRRRAMWRASDQRGPGLLIVAALLAVACGAPAAPTPATGKPASQPPAGVASGAAAQAANPASPAAPVPRQRVRVSYGAAVGSMQPIVAAKMLGEWASEGLDVEVDKIPSNTSVAALVA